MKKLICSLLLGFVIISTVSSQTRYFTRNGEITFTSNAPMEKIEATNYSASSVMELETGKMQFSVLIKAFEFKKALMQEHFNENYMESSKFPKATFKGEIKDIAQVSLDKEGEYEVVVSGLLTIHGVEKEVETKGTITVSNNKIQANSTFEVLVADYGIEIPALVKDNIAKVVEIKVKMDYQPFEKS